jgi:hypothetical protein
MANPTPNEVCQQQRKMYDRHSRPWRAIWSKMQKRKEFLDGDRYKQFQDDFHKHPKLIRIVGTETYDTIRHMVGYITQRPRSIEARPIDKIDDPAQAELAASMLTWDLDQPHKCFADRVEGMLWDACSRALGVFWLDWIPSQGPYGDRVVRRISPDRCMWDEAYEDPHEPGCTFFWESKRLPVDQIHSTYKGSDWVKPDKESLTLDRQSFRPGYPLLQSGSRGEIDSIADDDKATIWLCWYKNDPTYTSMITDNKTEALDPADRFMICDSGCGYQSPTQSQAGGEYPEQVLPRAPEELGGGCPTCGGSMTRVDERTVSKTEQAQRNGKRLVITAPYQISGEAKPIYDGDWPIPNARSFPGCFLTEYQEPGYPVGKCEVDLAWTTQFADDQLATLAIRRVFEYRTYWEIPKAGIEDQDENRFAFKDDDWIMIRNQTAANAPFDLSVRTHDAIGLDPQFMNVYQMNRQKLLSTRPKADFGITEESSKDIPVGTVQTLERQAEIATEHFNRRFRRSLSKFYGVAYDYMRATISPEQIARIRMDGSDMAMQGLTGEDLPDYDFWIEDSPQFSGIDKDKANGWNQAIQVAQQSPEFLESYGKFHNVQPSIIRSLEEASAAQQQRMQQQQEQQAQAMQGGIPPEMGGGAGMDQMQQGMQ